MLAHAYVGVHAGAWACEGRRKSLGISFVSRAPFLSRVPGLQDTLDQASQRLE